MSGRSVARLRYGLANASAVVSAVVDMEPAMKRRRLKGLLGRCMKCPSGIRVSAKFNHSVQIYSCQENQAECPRGSRPHHEKARSYENDICHAEKRFSTAAAIRNNLRSWPLRATSISPTGR